MEAGGRQTPPDYNAAWINLMNKRHAPSSSFTVRAGIVFQYCFFPSLKHLQGRLNEIILPVFCYVENISERLFVIPIGRAVGVAASILECLKIITAQSIYLTKVRSKHSQS